MSLALTECYRAVALDFLCELIGSESAATLASISEAVPGRADTFGFEVRLAEEDSAADLGVGFRMTAPVQHSLGYGDSYAAGTDARWRRIADFVRRLGEPQSCFSARVPFLFLEFDSDGQLPPVPVPGVFMGLDWRIDELSSEARQPGRDGYWHSTPGFNDALEMVRTLRRLPLTPGTETLLARSFATVPDGGLILHLAVMLGRPGEAVRISAMVPRQDARDYLLSLGWKDGLDELDRTLGVFGPYSDFASPYAPIQIDLDVGEEIGPTIGLMLQPPTSDRWPDLLDTLVRENLCAYRKRDGLLAWPGRTAIELESEGNIQRWVLERTLSHAKVTCCAGAPPKAKAYFGVTPTSDAAA